LINGIERAELWIILLAQMNKGKLAKAAFWGSTGVIGKQVIVFIVGIILARILEPSDFGLISMIVVFSNLGNVFIDFGFSKAIIQAREINRTELSTIFYFNIFLGLIIAVLFYLSSGAIATFYNQPELVNLTRFISLIFIFNSMSLVQRSLFLKKIDMKSESIIIVAAALLSGGIAITLALTGFGVWSLASKLVLFAFFEACMLWIMSKWVPEIIFRISTLKRFLAFSLNMFGAGLLNFLSQNLDKLLIGKLFNASTLGYFDRAKQFNGFLQESFGRIMGKVMFPVLSERQDDAHEFNLLYRKSINMVGLLFVPLFFSLSLVAEPLILLLLTDKWLPSVPILQILAISGFALPLSSIMVNSIAAKGRAKLFLQIGIIKNSLGLAGILIGSLWGILGVATAITITRYISVLINMYFATRLLKIPFFSQLNELKHAFLIALLIFAGLFILSVRLDVNHFVHLIGFPLAGFSIYFVLVRLFIPDSIRDLQKVLKELKPQNNSNV